MLKNNDLKVPTPVIDRALGVLFSYVYGDLPWPVDRWIRLIFPEGDWELNIWKRGENRYATIYEIVSDNADTRHFFWLYGCVRNLSCSDLRAEVIAAYVYALSFGTHAPGRPADPPDPSGRIADRVPRRSRKSAQG